MTDLPIYPLNEHIIESVIYKLTERLPEAVLRVNEAAPDNVAIEHVPESRIFTHVPSITEQLAYPCIGIMELPGEWTQDVGDSATGSYPFVVVVYVQNPDQERLVKQLRRMRQAIVSTLMEGRHLVHPTNPGALGAWGLNFDGFRPGRTLGPGEGNEPLNYTSWTSMAFTALAEDNPY